MIPTISELNLLYKYASECKFIIETGSGLSTIYFAKIAKNFNVKFISIEINSELCNMVDNVEYMNGWSVRYKDIIKKTDKDFIDTKRLKRLEIRNKDYIDRRIAYGYRDLMTGKKNLIRKALKKYEKLELDFFFCDSGEFCGLAEWNIVKNRIKIGGYFAIHDIYYPKSIKGFKVEIKIKKSKKWKIIEKTKSKQGLLIVKKVQ